MKELTTSLGLFTQSKYRLYEIGSRTAKMYEEAGDENRKRECELLVQSLQSECVKIAVIGEFKGGKSTLVNALIGEQLLPSWTTECSATIVQVRYGAEPSMIVYRENGEQETCPVEQLQQLATVDNDAHQDIRLIDVGYPAEVLKNGLCIVDTPGINSAVKARETIAIDFMNIADAIIVVLNAEYLLTANELEFIKREVNRRNRGKIFVVVNRCDVFKDEQENLGKCISDVQCRLKEVIPTLAKVYSTSALEALDARISGSVAGYESSGMAELERALAKYVVQDGAVMRLGRIRGALRDSLCEYSNELALRVQTASLDREKYEVQSNSMSVVLHREVTAVAQMKQDVQGGFMKMRNKLENDIKKLAADSNASISAKYKDSGANSTLTAQVENEITDHAREWIQYADEAWQDFNNDVMKWIAEELTQIDAGMVNEAKALVPVGQSSLISTKLSPIRVSFQMVSKEVVEYVNESNTQRKARAPRGMMCGIGGGLLAAGCILTGGFGALLAFAGGATLFSGLFAGDDEPIMELVKRPVKKLLQEQRLGSLDDTYNRISNEIMANIRTILNGALD